MILSWCGQPADTHIKETNLMPYHTPEASVRKAELIEEAQINETWAEDAMKLLTDIDNSPMSQAVNEYSSTFSLDLRKLIKTAAEAAKHYREQWETA